MLRIMAVRPGRLSYYFETAESFAENRLGLVEADGWWCGRLADRLDLRDEPVSPGVLGKLTNGDDPSGAGRLRPKRPVRNAAYDLTFAAPKSVSLLHALGPSEVVAETAAAHEGAVRSTLCYLESEAALVRRRGGGRDVVDHSLGLAAACFLHRTSRALDPHLHSHVVVCNLAAEPGGSFLALDARGLYAHAGVAGALYRAELRAELAKRLGLSFGHRRGTYADLLGIERPTIVAFSNRSRAIATRLDGLGAPSRALVDRVANETRPERDLSRAYGELVESWRERAYGLGVSMAYLQSLTRGAPGPVRSGDEEARHAVHDALLRFDGPFSSTELLGESYGRLAPGSPTASVASAVEAVLADRDLVVAKEPKRRVFARQKAPAPRPEQIYLSAPADAAHARVEELFGAAPRLWPVGPRPGSKLGVVVCELAASRPQGTLVLEAHLAEQVASGHRVLAVARDASRAAGLSAALGVEAVALSGPRRRSEPRDALGDRPRGPLGDLLHGTERSPLVVLDDRVDLPPRARAAVVDAVREARGTLVVLRRLKATSEARLAGTAVVQGAPHPREVRDGPPSDPDVLRSFSVEPPPIASSSLPRLTRFAARGEGGAASERVSVVLGNGLRALADHLEAMLDRSLPGGYPLVVAADLDFGALLSSRVRTPKAARAELASRRRRAVVVLGGRDVFDPGRTGPVEFLAVTHEISSEERRALAVRLSGVRELVGPGTTRARVEERRALVEPRRREARAARARGEELTGLSVAGRELRGLAISR